MTGKTKSRNRSSVEEEDKGWGSIFRSLSVEPAGFLIVCSIVVSHLLFANLVMETACRVDLGYPADTCKEIIGKVNATYKAQEREIQKVVASVQAITSVLFGSITVLVVLFIGPWSDANGRRVPLLLSCSGIVAFSVLMLICYTFLDTLKLTALGLTLVVVGPITLCGGAQVFAMSAYSYIADTTSSKSRTFRTGVLSASVRSGTPIGFAVGGGLTRMGVGTVTSLFVAIGLGLVGVLILFFTVKNTAPGKDKDNVENEEDGGTVTLKKTKRSAWIRYNPLTKLWEALAILIKKRKAKSTFLLLIFCHICYAAPGSGEYSMLYLFVREKLQWNVSDYGFFSMYNWLMSAVGVVLSMFILSRMLKISDPVVGLVAGISQIGGSTLYAFASTALAMYLASATDLMNGTIGVVVRSMLSKTVAPDEIGKLFALLGVLESLLPIVMVPTYAMTYRSTVTFFSGAFFLLSAAITIPAEIIFIYFICAKKGTSSYEQDAQDELDAENLKGINDIKGGASDDKDTEKEGIEDKVNHEMVKLMGPQDIYSSNPAIGIFEGKDAAGNKD